MVILINVDEGSCISWFICIWKYLSINEINITTLVVYLLSDNGFGCVQ